MFTETTYNKLKRASNQLYNIKRLLVSFPRGEFIELNKLLRIDERIEVVDALEKDLTQFLETHDKI